MLYKFRKILVLALCLALVCSLSVTAFAESSKSVSESYSNERTFVDASAGIYTYSTIGTIEVQTFVDGDPYTEASVACRYLDDEYNLCYVYDSDSNYYTTFLSVAISSNKIYHMVDASYDFWAEVPTDYGWQEFVLNDFTVEYDVT